VVDERLGVDGRYTQSVQRLGCLAAASWSFDVSSERLKEFCGLEISDTTIREIAQNHGAHMLRWQREEYAAVEEFRSASGDVEFSTDGTCVNTTGGWREMKVGIFSKRNRADAASPSEWNSRTLPKPHVSVAFAAIEKSDRFGRRWKAWRKRLGLLEPESITVLADGAKWIWEEQRKHLNGAEGVLDIFHAWQHVAETGKVLHADESAAATWTEAGRVALLESGWSGIERHVRKSDALTTERQSARQGLLNYLSEHRHHLHYRERLASGQSIGSGQVEGACKNLIGRRLKQTSARWKPRRVNRMAGLCSIMYSHQWNAYWNPKTG